MKFDFFVQASIIQRENFPALHCYEEFDIEYCQQVTDVA